MCRQLQDVYKRQGELRTEDTPEEYRQKKLYGACLLYTSISKKAEESVQAFDKELDVVVSKLSTEGWTLPAELNIYAVKRCV